MKDKLIRPGSLVTVSRDETRWPSRGSWSRWRGRTGTVVAVNRRGEGRTTEYGVVFGAVFCDPDGKPHPGGSGHPVYFLRHELNVLPG